MVLYLVHGKENKGRESLRLDELNRYRLAFPYLTDRKSSYLILLLLSVL